MSTPRPRTAHDGITGRPNGGQRLHQVTAQRADALLTVYLGLGTQRTIKAAWDVAGSMGYTLSLKTVERYSRQFDWQARAAAFDAERRAVEATGIMRTAQQADAAHASLGRLMQTVSQQALETRLAKPRAKPGDADAVDDDADPPVTPAPLTGTEIARLADVGMRNERLALGLATDRREVIMELTNALTFEITTVFQQVLMYVPEDKRPDAAAVYADGLDRVMQQRRLAAGVTDYETADDVDADDA